MPKKVNIDGQEVELFTQEELDAKAKEAGEAATKVSQEASTKASTEAVEQYKKDHPDQTEALTKAEKDLKEVNDKLEAAAGAGGSGDGDGDGNDSAQIKRLREERDVAEKKRDEETDKMQKQLQVITDTLVGNVKQDLLVKFSDGNEETRKKIELEYDGFAGDAVTKEEITARMEKAVVLATGSAPSQNIMDGASSGSDKGEGSGGEGEKKHVPSDNEKAVGKVLGITDEDREKYGPGGEKEAKNVSTAD